MFSLNGNLLAVADVDAAAECARLAADEFATGNVEPLAVGVGTYHVNTRCIIFGEGDGEWCAVGAYDVVVDILALDLGADEHSVAIGLEGELSGILAWHGNVGVAFGIGERGYSRPCRKLFNMPGNAGMESGV